jgi:hypothetical protein
MPSFSFSQYCNLQYQSSAPHFRRVDLLDNLRQHVALLLHQCGNGPTRLRVPPETLSKNSSPPHGGPAALIRKGAQ